MAEPRLQRPGVVAGVGRP